MAKRNRRLVGLIVAVVVIIATLISSGAAPEVLASGVEIPWERATPTPEGERWVLVGPAENPIRLDRRDPNFQKHYLTYCSAEEYKEVTGHKYEPPREVPRELLFPELIKEDIRRSEAFLEQLRVEGQAQLGTEEPPDEVHWEGNFPPAGRQLWSDCGAWCLAYAGTSVQKAQFEAWAANGWEPKWILSPLWLSSLEGCPDCSIGYLTGLNDYRDYGTLTQDRLPYGDGDCHWYEPSEEDLELAYPLRVESHEIIFARTTSGGEPYECGEIEDLMWALALGRNVTLAFRPRDDSVRAHGVAVGGYTPDEVHCINSWGSDWGPEGNGWFWFTWEQLLGEEPVGNPFFNPPKPIYFTSEAAVDWEGECTLPEAEYRDVCRADLAVIKSVGVDPVVAGRELVWILTVENNGPSDAANVVVTDTIPSGVTLMGTVTSQGSWESGNPDGAVNCSLGTISAGASATITITVSLDPSFTGTSLLNTATVSSSTSDPDLSNNSATEETAVITQADLAITKSGSPDPVVVGTDLTYLITVTNNGPSDAANVVVTDTLPAEVTRLDVEASQGSCNGTVCSLGTIPSGESATITITVIVNSDFGGESLANMAAVEGSSHDPDEGNNWVLVTTKPWWQNYLPLIMAKLLQPLPELQQLLL